MAPPQVMQDLIAGQIDFRNRKARLPRCRNSAPATSGHLQSRAEVPAGIPAMEIPTVDEAGLPGLYMTAWFALFAPKGTPKDIVAKLNAEVLIMLADPAVRQRLVELGHDSTARPANARSSRRNSKRRRSKSGGRSLRPRTSRRSKAPHLSLAFREKNFSQCTIRPMAHYIPRYRGGGCQANPRICRASFGVAT